MKHFSRQLGLMGLRDVRRDPDIE